MKKIYSVQLWEIQQNNCQGHLSRCSCLSCDVCRLSLQGCVSLVLIFLGDNYIRSFKTPMLKACTKRQKNSTFDPWKIFHSFLLKLIKPGKFPDLPYRLHLPAFYPSSISLKAWLLSLAPVGWASTARYLVRIAEPKTLVWQGLRQHKAMLAFEKWKLFIFISYFSSKRVETFKPFFAFCWENALLCSSNWPWIWDPPTSASQM